MNDFVTSLLGKFSLGKFSLGKSLKDCNSQPMDIASLRKKNPAGFLDGQMLIAMPGMSDARFARTVIYMCAHSGDGAMGIIINKPSRSIGFPDLLLQLDIIDKEEAVHLPRRVERVPVLTGGPVETTRGFVLHSMDVTLDDSTLPISENIGLTVTLDMLRMIARGQGPQQAVLALGYASWGAGQLEREIQENTWLHGPVTPALVFGAENDTKYDIALRQLGIDPAFLSQEAGHA